MNDTVTPSPTWVIDSYVAVSRWFESQTSIGYGKVSPSTIGLYPSDFQAPLAAVESIPISTPSLAGLLEL